MSSEDLPWESPCFARSTWSSLLSAHGITLRMVIKVNAPTMTPPVVSIPSVRGVMSKIAFVIMDSSPAMI